MAMVLWFMDEWSYFLWRTMEARALPASAGTDHRLLRLRKQEIYGYIIASDTNIAMEHHHSLTVLVIHKKIRL